MDRRVNKKDAGSEMKTIADEMYGYWGDPMMPPPPPNRYHDGGYHRGGCGCGTCLGFCLLPLIIIGLIVALL